MKHKVLTDQELRTLVKSAQDGKITVTSDTILTPAALDYIHEHNVQVVTSTTTSSMTVSKIPVPNGKAEYVDLRTGKKLYEKPEDMTHLHGNVLVSKNEPAIAFRGMLDSLMAQIMETQIAAVSDGHQKLCGKLDEVLFFVRKLMAAEVKKIPLGDFSLLGMDSQRLRYVTHNLKQEMGIEHPVPSYTYGKTAVSLNKLRTCVRETELSAVNAQESADIIEALNRLSSCVYILFCQIVSESKGISTVSEYCSSDNIPVEVSARHVHLTVEAAEAIFGTGFRLTPKKMLSQPGEFLSEQRVTLVSGGRTMKNVAVLGPERKSVQVELSSTDSRVLGINPPCRLSGDLKGSEGMEIQGPKGSIHVKEGAIIAKAHIHMTTEDAVRFGVKDGQRLSVRLETDRPVVLNDVIARVKDKSKSALAMHIDFDEANAGLVVADSKAVIIKRW